MLPQEGGVLPQEGGVLPEEGALLLPTNHQVFYITLRLKTKDFSSPCTVVPNLRTVFETGFELSIQD